MYKRNNNYPYQSSSPSSSVSQLAASLAQRVGNFVAGTRTPHLPTDAELEAEAKREREKSRREAERILTREAEERRKAEGKIFGMKDMAESLPPPPPRSQTISDPPSPSISPKSGGNWWTAAKSRLTPTKEKDPLTPAQQIILEAKAKEKERDKNPKGKEKEWPTHPEAKFNDPSLLNLNVPPAPPSRPIPASPVSPTPSRTQAPLLTPSPMRSISEGTSSPSKETPPLYTQFTPQGTLDVHGTLVTIAKRFEKLEKWTVGHVRALEDRMNDVERWLVEKEKEKEKDGQKEITPSKAEGQSTTTPEPSHELGEIKEELAELQGRVIELGREMARMNSRHSPVSPSSNLPPSHMNPAFTTPLHPRPPPTTARESTTPPMAMVSAKHTGTRLPYPAGDYASPPDNLFSPAHSPPSSVNSATRSRPVAIPTTNNNAPGLEGGLPSSTSLSTSYSSASFSSVSSISSRPLPASPISGSHSASNSITRVASPTPVSSSQSQEPATLTLPPPPKLPSSSSGSPRGSGGKRQTSVSPTPRKRYTVALGEPIVSREPPVQEAAPPPPAPLTRRTHSRNSSLASTASFMSMLSSASDDAKSDKGEENLVGDDDEIDQFVDETIGKSAASKLTGVVNGDGSSSNGGGGGSTTTTTTATEPSSEKPNSPSPRSKRRIRPQSAHDFSSFLNSHQQQQVQRQQRTSQQSFQSQSTQSSQSSASVAPLRPRWRSRSTDRGDGAGAASGGKDDGRTGRFIDPLVLRKQGRELGSKLPMPKPIGKVPVGQLVAFFDGDKKV